MIILGIDEAGRGPLFGRVYTSCVVLPHEECRESGFDFSLLKDSKKFTSKKKLHDVAEYIKQNALFYSIDYESESTIDNINILEATIKSMKKSIINVIKQMIQKGDIEPKLLLNDIICKVDGSNFKPLQFVYNDEVYLINYETLIKGDSLCKSISAASILAKDARDNYMLDLCERYPNLNEYYGLMSNMGYGTKKHIEGIRNYGYTQWHRKSFKIKQIN
jgi:ribonuclease HII